MHVIIITLSHIRTPTLSLSLFLLFLFLLLTCSICLCFLYRILPTFLPTYLPPKAHWHSACNPSLSCVSSLMYALSLVSSLMYVLSHMGPLSCAFSLMYVLSLIRPLSCVFSLICPLSYVFFLSNNVLCPFYLFLVFPNYLLGKHTLSFANIIYPLLLPMYTRFPLLTISCRDLFVTQTHTYRALSLISTYKVHARV